VLAEQAAAGPDRTPVTTLLDRLLLPRLTEQLRTAREWFAGNASATEHLNRVSISLDDFVAQRRPEAAAAPPAGVTVPFDRMATEVRAVRDDEYAATQRSAEEARDTYGATRQQLVIATLASLLAAPTVVLLLVRDLVPQLRAYAAFAADVAAGRQVRRLDPRGADELTHLGRALDDMVARTDATRRQEADRARTHREDPSRTPLLSCLLCAEDGGRSTCEPLLVAGQVIGSVLVTHEDAFDAADEARIKSSVAQAAPVLGNLRNLALAEFRANNDSLTGLPNKRATDDTLKRMVAQANRSLTPLAAAMLDLDHFKQINDRFGHAKGDEVLAAAGAAGCTRRRRRAGTAWSSRARTIRPKKTARSPSACSARRRNRPDAAQTRGSPDER